jgi:hypothetical protein
VAADYIAAVCIRYGLLLVAGGVVRMWVLPDAWGDAVAAGVILYTLVVLHTESAARYARRFRAPWYGRMTVSAACAHAFGAAIAYALSPLAEPRFTDPRGGGMQFEKLWVYAPSLFDVGRAIVIYAVLSAVWAVLIGWVSRAVWGAAPPERHLVHIRKRAGVDAGRAARN